MIEDLKTNDYVGTRSDEFLSRTVLDLVLVNRLRHLEEKDTFHRLLLSAEAPVSVDTKDKFGKLELVKGRADRVLGYGTGKAYTGSIVTVVEAKPHGSAPVKLPQMMVCMAAVYEARLGHTNNSVFGMLSDGAEFRFTFLDPNKRYYDSRPLKSVEA